MPERIGGLSEDDLRDTFQIFMSIQSAKEMTEAIHTNKHLHAPVFHMLLRQELMAMHHVDNAQVPPEFVDDVTARYRALFSILHYEYYQSKIATQVVQEPPAHQPISPLPLHYWLAQVGSQTECALAFICYAAQFGWINTLRTQNPDFSLPFIIQPEHPTAIIELLRGLRDSDISKQLDEVQPIIYEKMRQMPVQQHSCTNAIIMNCLSCRREFPAIHYLFINASVDPPFTDLIKQGQLNNHTCPYCQSSVIHPLHVLASELPATDDILLQSSCLCILHPTIYIYMLPPLTNRDIEMDRVFEIRMSMFDDILTGLIDKDSPNSLNIRTSHLVYSSTELANVYRQQMETLNNTSETQEKDLRNHFTNQFTNQTVHAIRSGVYTLDSALAQIREIAQHSPYLLSPTVPIIQNAGGDPLFEQVAMAIAEIVYTERDTQPSVKVLLEATSIDTHINTGDLGLAMTALERMKTAWQQARVQGGYDPSLEATVLHSEAQLLRIHDEYDQAIVKLKQSIKCLDMILSQADQKNLHWLEIQYNRLSMLNEMACCYQHIGWFKKALEDLHVLYDITCEYLHVVERYKSLFEDDDDFYLTFYNNTQYLLGGITSNIGYSYQKIAETGKVYNELLDKYGSDNIAAVIEQLTTASDIDHHWQQSLLEYSAKCEHNQSILLAPDGSDYLVWLRQQAENSFRAALAICEKIHGFHYASIQAANIGDILLHDKGQITEGIKLLEKAVKYARLSPGSDGISDRLYQLSHALEISGDLIGAAEQMNEAIFTRLRERLQAGTDSLRQQKSLGLESMAAHLATLRYQLQQIPEAVEALESVKSNLLAIELERSTPRLEELTKGDDDLNRLHLLENQREQLYAKIRETETHKSIMSNMTLSSKHKPHILAELNNQLTQLETDIKVLRERLLVKHPRFETWCRYTTMTEFKLKDILHHRQGQNHQAPVLGFFTTPKIIWAYLIQADHVYVKQIELDDKGLIGIMEKIFSIREALQCEFRPIHQTLLEQLANQLWGPLASKLDALPKGSDLILSLHGPLNFFPWALLPTVKGTLIRRFNLYHVFSLSVLETLQHERDQKTGNKILLVADPLHGSMFELPGAQEEAEQVAAVFRRHGKSAKILSGSEATIPAVVQAITDRQVIHFACHGSFSGITGKASELLLAPVNGQLFDSGHLTIHNIIENFNLRQTRLINLSACETGLVKQEVGGEINGLTRAFLCAGASNVLASLWPLHDQYACQFSERFYKNYLRTSCAAEALRKTQIACITGDLGHNMTHPVNWAGYILIGAPK